MLSPLLIFNYSWWNKIQKPRETRKVILELHITHYLTKLFNAIFTIVKQAISFCMPSSLSLYCYSKKVTSKNISPESCSVDYFCWQSAEIRLLYHLGAAYAKWFTLKCLEGPGLSWKKALLVKKIKYKQNIYYWLIHFHVLLSYRFIALHYLERQSNSTKKRRYINAMVYF